MVRINFIVGILKFVSLTLYMISHYIIFLRDALTLISYTPLDVPTLKL
jgi:hypothetical protein